MATISSVAVFGSTGFVGRSIVRELLAKGYNVRTLVRDRAKARRTLPPDPRLTVIQGRLVDQDRLDETLGGAQACINLIGILREERTLDHSRTFRKAHVEATRTLVTTSSTLGVKRFLQMSALGVRDVGVSEYQRTKWEAEQVVRLSTLDWTIFRPGLIHGPDGEFIQLVKLWCTGHHAPWLFIPYFCRVVEDKRVPLGPVAHIDPKVAPIAVEDVAGAFVGAITNPRAVGEVYNLVGSETLTWPALLRHMRDHIPGSNFEIEPHAIPSDVAAIGAQAASLVGLGNLMPFDEGMARMGAEDSTAELEKVKSELGFTPRPFSPAFEAYAQKV